MMAKPASWFGAMGDLMMARMSRRPTVVPREYRTISRRSKPPGDRLKCHVVSGEGAPGPGEIVTLDGKAFLVKWTAMTNDGLALVGQREHRLKCGHVGWDPCIECSLITRQIGRWDA